MSEYHVHVANCAVREIKKLTKQAQAQVVAVIEALGDDPMPHGFEKLASRPSFLRVRSGDYRIIYTVKRELRLVIILVVRDRKDAFKGLEDLDGKLASAMNKVADNLLNRAVIEGSA